MQKLIRYWPVATIYLVSALVGWWWGGSSGEYSLHTTLSGFMGTFLILFGAIKLKDINGFANRFATYDLIAKKYWWYGQLFPFIELTLGVLMFIKPVLAVDATMVVLSLIGIAGVYGSIIKKQRLYCACLGTSFNVPLSYVAIFENGTMLVSALAMILL